MDLGAVRVRFLGPGFIPSAAYSSLECRASQEKYAIGGHGGVACKTGRSYPKTQA